MHLSTLRSKPRQVASSSRAHTLSSSSYTTSTKDRTKVQILTQKTALELARGLKYKDKAISCAIKSENLLKGLQPGSPPKGAPTNGMYGGWNGAYAPGGYAPNGWNGGGAYAGAEGGFGRGGRGAPVTRGGRAGARFTCFTVGAHKKVEMLTREVVCRAWWTGCDEHGQWRACG